MPRPAHLVITPSPTILPFFARFCRPTRTSRIAGGHHDNQPPGRAIIDPDRFPVNWHPHRGMDILSYLKTGVGRHGDSMGNRENFETPGMQWISCGSGIEHAEGGGTPKGELRMLVLAWA